MNTHIGEAILPGMIANFTFLICSHYILRQPGGYVGIKEDECIIQARQEKLHRLKSLADSIKNFSFTKFFRSNIPDKEIVYSIFGIFSLITTICCIYSSAGSSIISKSALLFFFESMMLISMSFIAYPIWPDSFKESKVAGIIWKFCIIYILIICSTFFAMLTNFSELQIIVFAMDLIVIGMLLRWQAALLVIFVGIYTTSFLYEYLIGAKISISTMISLEQQISYMIIIFASLLVMVFRPRQESEEITEERNIYLKEKIASQKHELASLVNLKSEFLRNLNHELHTPVTGVTSMAQGLFDNYKNMTEAERYDCIKIIANSGEKFDKYTGSILDLARLSSDNLELKHETIDLTRILYDSIDTNLRLHPNPNIEIVKRIDNNVKIKGDDKYFRLIFDNLIANALAYSSRGKINIKLTKLQDKISFSIEDQGLGISLDELYDIFSPFTVGSKTKSTASGKGVGLAICKKAIEAHGGRIWAESDGKTGSTFKFELLF